MSEPPRLFVQLDCVGEILKVFKADTITEHTDCKCTVCPKQITLTFIATQQQLLNRGIYTVSDAEDLVKFMKDVETIKKS